MAVTTPATKASRPLLLSADKRKISYTSKSGKTLTVELRQSSRAIETLRELATRETKEDLARKEIDGAQVSEGSFFDTISFWCMEAVEIACFGPYDEPPVIESVKATKLEAPTGVETSAVATAA